MTPKEAEIALNARLVELDKEDQTNQDASDTVELQQDSVGRLSRMDALQQQAMAQAQARRRVQERLRIKAAVERIKEGEWGYCVSCGEDIAAARVNNDPSVALCLKCASGQN